MHKFHYYLNRVVESGVKNVKVLEALGECYEFGWGVSIDIEKALGLYIEAQICGGRTPIASILEKILRSKHEKGEIRFLKPNRKPSANMTVTEDNLVPIEDIELECKPVIVEGKCQSLSFSPRIKKSSRYYMENDGKSDSKSSSSHSPSSSQSINRPGLQNKRANIRTQVLEPDEFKLYSEQEIAKLERESTAQSNILNANLAFYYMSGLSNPNLAKFHLYASKVKGKGFWRIESLFGFCYENGFGIEQDIAMAVSHYEEARKLGEIRNFGHLTEKLFAEHRKEEQYKHLANVPAAQIETLFVEIDIDATRFISSHTFCHRNEPTNREIIKQAFKNSLSSTVLMATQNTSQNAGSDQTLMMFSAIQNQRNRFKRTLDALTFASAGSKWKFSESNDFYWLRYPIQHKGSIENALKTNNIQFSTKAVAVSSNSNNVHTELVTSVAESDKNLFQLDLTKYPEDHKSKMVGHLYRSAR